MDDSPQLKNLKVYRDDDPWARFNRHFLAMATGTLRA